MSGRPFAVMLACVWLIAVSLASAQSKIENRKSKVEPLLPYGTVRSQRLNSGVPFGGIGCGSFQLLTDGTISRATINNNWAKPTGDLNGCFAAVWTNAGGRIVTRSLTLKSPYGLPPVAGVDYLGLFPQAFVQFPDTTLPVSVSLRAFSPLVPQDLMSSTVPAALFVFTIRNEARAPVDASIAFSWENFIGVGGSAAKGAFADRTGNTVAPLPPVEGTFGVRMAGPSRPPTDPANRLYYNAQGNYALMAQPTSADTVVTTGGWNALDKAPGWWARFERDGTVEGSIAAGREGAVHPAGVVALKVSLKANESREIPFAVAWFTPRLYTLDGAEYGHFYQKVFADAPAVARYVLQNRLAFAALTDEWQRRLLRSTLPPWLVQRLINDASILATNTVYTRDSGLAGTQAGPSLFAVLAQPGVDENLGAMDSRLYAHALLAALFPRQDVRELEQFAAIQTPAGAIPRFDCRLDAGIATGPAGGSSAGAGAVGSSASFAYQVAQYFAWTGDRRFLDRFYPVAKHALEFAASRTLSLAVSDEPTAQERALLRGAIAGGEQLAIAVDDRRFADQCRGWASSLKPAADPALAAMEQWMIASITSAAPPGTMPAPSAAPAVLPDAAVTAALLTLSGNVEAGLATLQEADRAIVEQMKSPWSYPLPPGDTAGSSLAAPASWYLLQAITGPAFDPVSGRLSLTPRVPPPERAFRVPVFAPTYWATMDYSAGPSRVQLQFTLDRSLPVATEYEPPSSDTGRKKGPSTSAAALTIRQVILAAPQNSALQLTASLNRSPLTGKSAPDGKGRIVFTPDAPITLSTGQRLEFLFRP